MSLAQVLGGLALFLFGLAQVAEHLQVLAGAALQRLLRRAREAPWIGLGAGAAVTAVAQSATAIGVMSARLMQGGTLRSREALAVMLGAAVGGTLAVQLVSLKVTDSALALIALGFALTLFTPRALRSAGAALLGLGLAFLGLGLMIDGLAPLQQSALTRELLAQVAASPWLMAAFGFVLTLVLHSSNAPVVLVMAMAGTGMLGLAPALAVVLGANLGTPVNIYLMTLGQGIEAKRAALAHIGIKALAVLMAVPLIALAPPALAWIDGDSARQLANAHTLFNLLVALAVLPALAPIDRALRRWLPDPPAQGPRPKYIDDGALHSPDFAYGLAFREMARVADHVLRMARAAFDARDAEPLLLEHVRREEEVVDTLVHELVKYLGRLHDQLPAERIQALLAMCSSLEGIGDLLKRLLRQRHKLWSQGLALSDEGRAEIDAVAAVTLSRAREMLTALSMGDIARCESSLDGRAGLTEAMQASRLAHLARLNAGRDDSRMTSTVHLDSLTLLEQINTELDNIARRAGVAFAGQALAPDTGPRLG